MSADFTCDDENLCRVDRTSSSKRSRMATNEAVWVQVTVPDDKIEEFLKVPDPAAAWLPVSKGHCSPCHATLATLCLRLHAPSVGR